MAESSVDIQRLVVSMEAKLNKFDKQMAAMGRQTDKNLAGVEKRFQKAEGVIAKFGANAKAGLTGLGSNLFAGLNPTALIAGLGGAGIAAFAKNAIRDLGDVADNAERTGLSIKNMQRLTFAGLSESASAGDIVDVFQKLNKELADAATKGGDLADILAANNIPLKDQNGQLRSNIDLFFEIVDLIKNAKNETDRQLISQLAMGRSAGDMLNLFNQGAAAIKALGDEAEKSGFVIDEKLVRAADEFDKNWNLTWATWTANGKGSIVELVKEFENLGRLMSGEKLVKGSVFSPNLSGDMQFESLDEASARKTQAKVNELKRAREFYDKAINSPALPPEQREKMKATLADVNAQLAEAERNLRHYREQLDEVRPPVGPTVKPTVVPVESEKKAAAKTETDAAKAEESAAKKAATDRAQLKEGIDVLFAATQREILVKQMEAEAFGKSTYEIERNRKEMELLARLEEEHRQNGGAVTAEEIANVKLLADSWGTVNQAMSDREADIQSLRDVTDTVFGDMESAIDQFIETGKGDVKSLVVSILKDLAKLAVHNLFQSLQFGTPGSGDGGGLVGNLISRIVGAPKAGPTASPSQAGPSIGIPNLSPSQQARTAPLPGLSAPLTPIDEGISNAEYFAQFRDAIPGMAKTMLPKGVLDPFFKAASASGGPPGAGAMSGNKSFLDFIAMREGTDFHRGSGAPARGYNETLDYGRWTGGDRNLTGMNLDEIAALQQQMRTPANRALYGNGKGSSALGRYQITGETMKGLRKDMGLKGDELFDPAMQDKMALKLMARRGPNATGLKAEWQGLNGAPDADILAKYNAQIMASGKGLSSSLTNVSTTAAASASDFTGSFGPALNDIVGAIGGGGAGGAAAGTGKGAGGAMGLIQPLMKIIPGFAGGGHVGEGGGEDIGVGATPDRRSAFFKRNYGKVTGRGTGKSDSIMAKLSNGEFVVNADATAKNLRLLELINSGGGLPGFASGGMVGDNGGRITPAVPRLAMPNIPQAVPAGGGGRQQVDVNIKADASPYLLLETDTRAGRIAKAGDSRTLKTADRQAPQRMAKFNQLGT